MATNTYVALDKVTVGTAVSSITLSSINQGYTDLVLVVNAASSSAASCRIRFNADTGTNYSDTRLYGDGSSATSDRLTNRDHINCGDLSVTSITSNQIINIMNYSNATTYKTVLTRSNIASSYVFANASVWRATPAAITSITVFPASGNFVAGSTFSLYGIAAAAPLTTKATGGTIVQAADGYVYHTFTSSGTFTPSQNLTCDYLVIAGGGGGGNGQAGQYAGGGGGAGGLRSTIGTTGGGGSLESALALTSGTGYTVTIGAGGAANTSGANSVFGSITATAGGKGGYNTGSNPPAVGGSGGGGGSYDNGAAGTANQGFAGGNSEGGGGGAGAVGIAGSSGGIGGAGVAISAFALATGTGVNNYYAGGGGAGGPSGRSCIGGAGGGGNGGAPANGSPGTANTGGGGGGSNVNTGSGTGGAGGSGIVIVRYLG